MNDRAGRNVSVWQPIVLVLTTLAVACNRESEPLDHPEIIMDDLHAIIEFQGSPCGEISDYRVNDDLDYHVVCETGHVYRIHVSAEGHVNVTPHEE